MIFNLQIFGGRGSNFKRQGLTGDIKDTIRHNLVEVNSLNPGKKNINTVQTTARRVFGQLNGAGVLIHDNNGNVSYFGEGKHKTNVAVPRSVQVRGKDVTYSIKNATAMSLPSLLFFGRRGVNSLTLQTDNKQITISRTTHFNLDNFIQSVTKIKPTSDIGKQLTEIAREGGINYIERRRR